jgi:hypothetical protein
MRSVAPWRRVRDPPGKAEEEEKEAGQHVPQMDGASDQDHPNPKSHWYAFGRNLGEFA